MLRESRRCKYGLVEDGMSLLEFRCLTSVEHFIYFNSLCKKKRVQSLDRSGSLKGSHCCFKMGKGRKEAQGTKGKTSLQWKGKAKLHFKVYQAGVASGTGWVAPCFIDNGRQWNRVEAEGSRGRSAGSFAALQWHFHLGGSFDLLVCLSENGGELIVMMELSGKGSLQGGYFFVENKETQVLLLPWVLVYDPEGRSLSCSLEDNSGGGGVSDCRALLAMSPGQKGFCERFCNYRESKSYLMMVHMRLHYIDSNEAVCFEDGCHMSSWTNHMVRGTWLSKNHELFHYGLPSPLLDHFRRACSPVIETDVHTFALPLKTCWKPFGEINPDDRLVEYEARMAHALKISRSIIQPGHSENVERSGDGLHRC
ncbi:hypothetical protein Acr_27g0000180 [Actinidia rufa]|uniref:Uncharacterized protein n=1 Tax=Actinidia rufa TaxID=165716 RepID=A0A7J0H5E3_9ERIC|nr:hypothetical protein Acr_27g0000180 [Actinidia rufa]